ETRPVRTTARGVTTAAARSSAPTTTAVRVSPRATPRTSEREPRRSEAPPGPHHAMSIPAANPAATDGASAGPTFVEVSADTPRVAQNAADIATSTGTMSPASDR